MIEQFRAPRCAAELPKIIGRFNNPAPEQLEPNAVGGGSPEEWATWIGDGCNQIPTTAARHRVFGRFSQQGEPRQRSGFSIAMGRTADMDGLIQRASLVGHQGSNGRSAGQQGVAGLDRTPANLGQAWRVGIQASRQPIGIPLLGR